MDGGKHGEEGEEGQCFRGIVRLIAECDIPLAPGLKAWGVF